MQMAFKFKDEKITKIAYVLTADINDKLMQTEQSK